MSSYLLALSLDGLARFGLAFAGPGRLVKAALKGRDALGEEQARRRRTAEVRAKLARLLEWPVHKLPATGGWAGMPDFLLVLAETVRERRPKVVVEFGSGASTVVIARALQIEGGGRLVSYDHHAGFAEAARRRLAALGLTAEVRAVDLVPSAGGYTGKWYAGDGMPEAIDLAVIDGPPAWLEAGTRGGAAPAVFPRIVTGGLVLLDDAKRDGERENVRQWQAEFPQFSYREIDTDKGIVAIERA